MYRIDRSLTPVMFPRSKLEKVEVRGHKLAVKKKGGG
jgi:hypothetical protein